jgi:glycosyltransferase involved in cell wall biosynthesis
VRVGLLTTSYPRHDGDVAGSFVLGFARALATQGHDVEVLAPEPADRVAGAPPAVPGVSVVHVPDLRPRALQRTFYGAGVPDTLRGDARAWLGPIPFVASLGHAVLRRRARWDAVVSHWALPCGLVAGALRGGLRHVSVLHSADVHALATLPGGAAAARALVERSDVLWFVSELGRRRFLDRLPAEAVPAAVARSMVQPMGFELPQPGSDHVHTLDREGARARLGLDRFTLLSIARLVPVKGLYEAIEALGHRHDLDWLIAGDGPDHAALARLSERVRLRVRLLGTVTGPDKTALLRAADAFVLPSRVLPTGRTEGVPIALLEAMASGTPVIASAVGGIREWLTHEQTGLALLHLGQLEQAIDRLATSPELARSLADRASSHVSGLTWTALAPKLSAIVQGSKAGTVLPSCHLGSRPSSEHAATPQAFASAASRRDPLASR